MFLKTLIVLLDHPEFEGSLEGMYAQKRIDWFRTQFRKFDEDGSGYMDAQASRGGHEQFRV